MTQKQSIGHICRAAKKKCYALLWSYGEICVHCGCCAKDKETRRKARLAYWQCWLEEQENFNRWIDNPELRQLQEKNRKANIAEAKKRIRYYIALTLEG